MNNYELSFRVNDTSITHIVLLLKTDCIKQVINTAIRRLEKQGYIVCELVYIRKNGQRVPV